MLINAAEARPAARGGSRAMARPCRLGTAAQANPQNDPHHERRYTRAFLVGQEQRHMVGRVSAAPSVVMAGLVPAIHVLPTAGNRWMPANADKFTQSAQA